MKKIIFASLAFLIATSGFASSSYPICPDEYLNVLKSVKTNEDYSPQVRASILESANIIRGLFLAMKAIDDATPGLKEEWKDNEISRIGGSLGLMKATTVIGKKIIQAKPCITEFKRIAVFTDETLY
jgi:hypothetical protein